MISVGIGVSVGRGVALASGVFVTVAVAVGVIGVTVKVGVSVGILAAVGSVGVGRDLALFHETVMPMIPTNPNSNRKGIRQPRIERRGGSHSIVVGSCPGSSHSIGGAPLILGISHVI